MVTAADQRPRVIYVLRDPDTLEIRYVGVTLRSIDARLACHLSEAKSGQGKSHRANWISSLLARDRKPIAEHWCDVDPARSWQDVEVEVIASLRVAGFRLVNGTIGGDGTTGRDWRPSEEWRRNMGAAQLGKKATEATKLKRSQSLKRLYASDPDAMRRRQDLCRAASRSEAARLAGSKRMTSIWSDPVKAAEMSQRMRGARARKAGAA